LTVGESQDPSYASNLYVLGKRKKTAPRGLVGAVAGMLNSKMRESPQ
jgi:hypothetical protein